MARARRPRRRRQRAAADGGRSPITRSYPSSGAATRRAAPTGAAPRRARADRPPSGVGRALRRRARAAPRRGGRLSRRGVARADRPALGREAPQRGDELRHLGLGDAVAVVLAFRELREDADRVAVLHAARHRRERGGRLDDRNVPDLLRDREHVAAVGAASARKTRASRGSPRRCSRSAAAISSGRGWSSRARAAARSCAP